MTIIAIEMMDITEETTNTEIEMTNGIVNGTIIQTEMAVTAQETTNTEIKMMNGIADGMIIQMTETEMIATVPGQDMIRIQDQVQGMSYTLQVFTIPLLGEQN